VLLEPLLERLLVLEPPRLLPPAYRPVDDFNLSHRARVPRSLHPHAVLLRYAGLGALSLHGARLADGAGSSSFSCPGPVSSLSE
jgi:hypothetical protein